MSEVHQQAETFLNDIFTHAGFELRARAADSDSGCTLEIEGPDASLLRSEGGELLDALEHFVNQSLGRELPHGERYILDVENFRALRETELRAMARHAAERVYASGVPFTFAPMNANERRVIHLALADDERLFTESVGEGNARRLKVSLKKTS
jgi:spoIIIJ-associated protein